MRSGGDGSGELPRRAGGSAGTISPERVAALAWTLKLQTLEEVLHRGLDLVDVVVQDEYTHDVVTRAGKLGELYAVFDAT
jgi:hypothetical protein